MKTIVRDDPLIGKIYHSADRQEMTYQQLLEKSLQSDIIYLGEKHDNPEHHQHQLKIVQDFIDKGKRPRLGFEFFSAEQTGDLMSYITQKQASFAHGRLSPQMREQQLRQALGWQYKPDETWRFYFQFIQLAEQHNLIVFGTDLPKGIIDRITRSGLDQLTAVEKSFLKSSHLEDDAYRKLMFRKFTAAHCGFGMEELMAKMYQTWLERNDAMAEAIVETFQAEESEPIIMILGKGHVEHNLAVYDRVAHRLPSLRQFTLGFVEIAIDPTPLEDYFQIEQIGERRFLPYYEYVWFTQRANYEDPCKKFRKVIDHMKKK